MKRILLSLATVGALSALITGATFALFTSTASNNNNTFSAGTVELGDVTRAECRIGGENMAPGDSGECSVKVKYRGSLAAWIGVDMAFEDTDPTDSVYLFDKLDVWMTGGDNYNGSYLLGKYTNGEDAQVTVHWKFDRNAGNDYQGKSGKVHLTFKAVQARNNTETDGAGNELGPTNWN